MVEKRKTMSFTTTPSNAKVLLGLAESEGITFSDYIHKVLADHIDKKLSEFMLLARALNVDINDINVSND